MNLISFLTDFAFEETKLMSYLAVQFNFDLFF